MVSVGCLLPGVCICGSGCGGGGSFMLSLYYLAQNQSHLRMSNIQ